MHAAQAQAAKAEANRAQDQARVAELVAAQPIPQSGYRGLLTFDPPVPGCLSAEANRPLKVHALAEVDGQANFLCSVKGEKQARWLNRTDVTFSAPQVPAQAPSVPPR